jgi:hypothetical protein
VVILAGLCGFAIGGLVPIANGQFVKALPNAFRARAFGVVQGGLALLQGGAVLVTGALANETNVPLVVGLWSLCGVGLMVGLSLAWPSPQVFTDAVAAADAANNLAPPAVTPPIVAPGTAPEAAPATAAAGPVPHGATEIRPARPATGAAHRQPAPGTMEP